MKTLEHLGYTACLYDKVPDVPSYYQNAVVKAKDNGIYIWTGDKLDLFTRTITWHERILAGVILQECKERGLDVEIHIAEREVFDDFGNEELEEELTIEVLNNETLFYRFTSNDYQLLTHYHDGRKYLSTIETNQSLILSEYDIKKYIKFVFDTRHNFAQEFMLSE